MTDHIAWLLEGDPAVRWQVMRDLLDASPEDYLPEQQRVAQEGWGAAFLALQGADGDWGGGLYSPKWVSTHYTLLQLKLLGLPPGNPQAVTACQRYLDRGFSEVDDGIFGHKRHPSDTCIVGMVLGMATYFDVGDDPRLHRMAEHIHRVQMADGGWNCRWFAGARHSSVHTTMSVLEGLQQYAVRFPDRSPDVAPYLRQGMEFLLMHRLYKSDNTGEVIRPSFTNMPFPPHWKYDFMRALDFFQSIQAPWDARLQDAIDLLKSKQLPDGRWKLSSGPSGIVHFNMERAGQPSRWNTLRGLRVLRWYTRTLEE